MPQDVIKDLIRECKEMGKHNPWEPILPLEKGKKFPLASES